MTIDIKTLPRSEPIYTFVGENGETTYIASNLLRLWCTENRALLEPQIHRTFVRPGLASQFIRDNVVDFKRVLQLTQKHLEDPIIYCQDGTFTAGLPNVYLVDGHHRFVRAAVDRRQYILTYILKLAQWEPFRVVNAPTISKQGLRDLPITKRTY